MEYATIGNEKVFLVLILIYYIYIRERLLNIHYILYFYGIYIMIHDDHIGLKMEKKLVQ